MHAAASVYPLAMLVKPLVRKRFYIVIYRDRFISFLTFILLSLLLMNILLLLLHHRATILIGPLISPFHYYHRQMDRLVSFRDQFVCT